MGQYINHYGGLSPIDLWSPANKMGRVSERALRTLLVWFGPIVDWRPRRRKRFEYVLTGPRPETNVKFDAGLSGQVRFRDTWLDPFRNTIGSDGLLCVLLLRLYHLTPAAVHTYEGVRSGARHVQRYEEGVTTKPRAPLKEIDKVLDTLGLLMQPLLRNNRRTASVRFRSPAGGEMALKLSPGHGYIVRAEISNPGKETQSW